MSDQQDGELVVFNGLDGSTGCYLTEPVTIGHLRDQAYRVKDDPTINLWESDDHLQDLIIRDGRSQPSFDIARDADPSDLSSAGWGIIFPEGADLQQVEQIKEALSDLIDLRKDQAGDRFKIYYGDGDGYRPGETGEQFTARHGLSFGSVDPEVMPFYLMIVADPASIPYSFQHQLDVQFAVGRIYFETLVEYAQYARSVWTAEQRPALVNLPRQAVFFGVQNPDDRATALSTEFLIQPLYQYSSDEKKPPRKNLGWSAEHVAPDQATKANLKNYLGGSKTPALLFTASHGVGWPNGDARQYPLQGGLVCQDWPGKKNWSGELTRDVFIAAEDIESDASLLGMVAFFFACYGAGTPYLDDYAVAQNLKERERLAPRPFLAALPRRLLSHPRGGALAVVGHVERAWGCSFRWQNKDADPVSFRDFLFEAMDGMPIGYAMESLNNRYGQIATRLNEELGELKYNKNYPPYTIAQLWTANNDARAYAIIGDPAVRLPLVDKGGVGGARPITSGVKPFDGTLPPVLVQSSLNGNMS